MRQQALILIDAPHPTPFRYRQPSDIGSTFDSWAGVRRVRRCEGIVARNVDLYDELPSGCQKLPKPLVHKFKLVHCPRPRPSARKR